MFLILSASLHPNSRSRILAASCADLLRADQRDCEIFDLAESPLPMCDGATAYGDPNVQRLAGLVTQAEAILVATPVYNYDVNAALKNSLELTGKAWTGQVVSLMLAAGGQGSYMSAMGFANSLMLDFRCLIVPRFVYATGESFEGNSLADESIAERVSTLVRETTQLADAVNGISDDA